MRLNPDSWIVHHDRTVDLAVHPLNIKDESPFQMTWVMAESSLSNEKELHVAPGCEVFMVGCFTRHFGAARNVPIVRTGHIAAFPPDPVQTGLGPARAMLIESRSIGGLSGSPVFVHLGLWRVQNEKLVPIGGYEPMYRFAGVVHGHWQSATGAAADPVDSEVPDGDFGGRDESLHTGIAVVTPSEKLEEMFRSGPLADLIERSKTRASSPPPTTDTTPDC
jgi:hypothetical protein